MMITTSGKMGIQLESQLSHRIPTAPTKANTSPQTAQTIQKKALPVAASRPMAVIKKVVAEYVNTACQPICKTPIKSPGIKIPPCVPNVDEPTT